MAYINRSYSKNGYNTNMYYGGNCGCSDCLNKGGNKMLPFNHPLYQHGLPKPKPKPKKKPKPMDGDAHILPYPYQNERMCNCADCIQGGNFFDDLANFMPSALNYVPLFGPLLSSGAQLTLDVIDPYRKNPQHQQEPEIEPYKQPEYQPMTTNYSTAQKNIVNRLAGRGRAKKRVRFNVPKKGSAEMKAKMAYLRSLKKQ